MKRPVKVLKLFWQPLTSHFFGRFAKKKAFIVS